VELRVLVNTGDQVLEARICRNFNAVEGMLKQTSSPVVGLVERLGIGIEEVAELLAGF
jgi:hypothetical protein